MWCAPGCLADGPLRSSVACRAEGWAGNREPADRHAVAYGGAVGIVPGYTPVAVPSLGSGLGAHRQEAVRIEEELWPTVPHM